MFQIQSIKGKYIFQNQQVACIIKYNDAHTITFNGNLIYKYYKYYKSNIKINVDHRNKSINHLNVNIYMFYRINIPE
jgi:capsule polysaccharide export protein KpsE/RkpR